ncbi:MAG: DUF6434 domain-containing protein [Bdellovibrionota bacterium]
MRPCLTNLTQLDEFLSFYWLKKELSDFCSANALPTHGSKEELTKRIKRFLTTGKKQEEKVRQNISLRDSDKPINLKTKVVNYKNDTNTRKFFIEQIGSHFHFNSYLRQFKSESFLKDKELTYGDLVEGWIQSESVKKDPNHKTTINSQFEYNQFIRDFFMNEKSKTRKDAIEAWEFIKQHAGKTNYEHYKKLK